MTPVSPVRPVKIGAVTLKGNVTLAPMAGYGDVAFRRLCRDYGASLTTTEMVSVKGLYYGSEKTRQLLRTAPNETPSAVQLFGSDAEYFDLAVRSPELAGFSIIDINMGCPVPKVTKNGEGSALMRDEKRAAKIVEACVRAAGNRPVTVKIRLGLSEESLNAVPFARAMESAGAAAVTVHGRTAEQAYRGRADWNAISAVAAALRVPVFGNGDVTDATECRLRLRQSGCAGIAVGRGALGHPELFREAAGGGADRLLDVVLRHLGYMLQYLPERLAVTEMRKHLVYYLRGVPDCKQLRTALNAATSAAETERLLRSALGGIPTC